MTYFVCYFLIICKDLILKKEVIQAGITNEFHVYISSLISLQMLLLKA